MSEFTGKGRVFELDNISKLLIFTSISPVGKLVLIVLSFLSVTSPIILITLSLFIFAIFLNDL